MKFINKLERKFGRYAIHNLIQYVIILYALGAVLTLVNPAFYWTFLSLDIGMVLQGQIWRLVTFIIQPYPIGEGINIIFFLFEMYLYFMIGRSLENAWGAFRFNLYYLAGILFNVIAAVLIYSIFGIPYLVGLTYINRSMFLAFAALYPNVQFLLFYIIPIKVKWLGYLYAAYILLDVVKYAWAGNIIMAVSIIVAIMNFLIFFMYSRNFKKLSPAQYKRKAAYKKHVKMAAGVTRHKCSVCGRTEQEDESLEFRFCSRCDGNYEYCMEHLFTHEHIHKQ